MSIIERAAELLKTDSQARPGPGETAGTSKRGLVERAAADLVQGRASEPPGAPGANNAPERAPGVEGRQFKVDLDRLRARSFITPDSERTPIAESFRRVKRQIMENIANPKVGSPPGNLVMVTSAFSGEGKSFCALNLAISMALELDRTVLLVDADAARASLPRTLGLKAELGLMEVLLDHRIGLADVLWKTDIGSLTLLPAGSAHKHATELLASEAMRGLLREMAERYHDRIIVFDSSPLLAASEASALASQVGQIVVVVEAGKTSEAALKDALGRIDLDRVTGLLLNKVEGPHFEYGYDAYG